ncbi:MAG: hypothetical protein IPJ23_15365 [Ignavibacteriales bacterium]|nr:hypothetical protein [Ignavibacteriales bacterium]
MKNIILSVYAVCLFILSNGCSIKEAYLLRADIDGPASQIPIHTTKSLDNDKASISIRVSGTTQQHINGSVSRRNKNIYTDSLYAGKNLGWDVSKFDFNVDADFKLGKNFALFGGFDFSERFKDVLIGGNVGLGFVGGDSLNAIRFDAGLKYQTMHIRGYYYAEAEFLPFNLDFNYIALVDKEDGYFNPFFSLTYNSTHKDWFVNPVFQIGYVSQDLFNIEVGSKAHLFIVDDEITLKSTISILSLTPGVNIALGENHNLLIGVRYFHMMSADDLENTSMFLPFAQIDFRF